MAKRYELTEKQYAAVRELLPGKAGDPGRMAQDNRRFLDGVLWVLRSGAHWHDMPERYGNWKSQHKRFSRWASKGVWEKIFARLIRDPDNDYVMIDSTLVKAHQQAAAGKKGRRSRRWGDPAEG
jgi:transposase